MISSWRLTVVFQILVIVTLVSTLSVVASAESIHDNLRRNEEGVGEDGGTGGILQRLRGGISNLFHDDRALAPSPIKMNYELIDAAKIGVKLQQWARQYPNLVRVTTAQAQYGLPTAGTKNDCPFDTTVDGCLNYIVTIQDFIAHPNGSETSNKLPEVFWSGELHGNERVGPTTVLETMNLLLNATTCESYQWTGAASRATACRQYLYRLGVDDTNRRWLARIVTTRRIVVIPTANALGYYRNEREEDMYDPNRDFAFDLLDNSDCMKTIASRTINEVYRDHIFQMSLTFHGGMEVLSYEWGATSWVGFMSPDDISQNRITAAMSQYAGAFAGTSSYQYGASNDVVYDIRGGMEDWAYAGSFDLPRVNKCTPTTYGGYPKSKTTYDNSTLRSIIILIETSNDKIPAKNTLGTTYDMLNPKSTGNGHVARNIRLSLMSADVVEPYVTISKVNGVTRTVDIVPLVNRTMADCKTTNVMTAKYSSTKPITIEWTVGGAIDVDTTQLWYGLWKNVPNLKCFTQPSSRSISRKLKKGTMIGPTSGKGRLSSSGVTGTTFQATLDPMNYQVGDKLVVIVSAAVDQVWKNKVPNTGPNVPPQTHLVNVRTNPKWYYQHSKNGKSVQGRVTWYSIPVSVTIVA